MKLVCGHYVWNEKENRAKEDDMKENRQKESGKIKSGFYGLFEIYD